MAREVTLLITNPKIEKNLEIISTQSEIEYLFNVTFNLSEARFTSHLSDSSLINFDTILALESKIKDYHAVTTPVVLIQFCTQTRRHKCNRL